MSKKVMLCRTCNIVHEHPIGPPEQKGFCWCKYMDHDVVDIDKSETFHPTYEELLYRNIKKVIDATKKSE